MLNDSFKEDTLAQRGSSFCPLPKICKYFVTLGDHMSSLVNTLDCCSPLIFSTFTTNLSSIIWQCFCHNKLLLSLFDLHFHHLAGACLWFFFFFCLFYFILCLSLIALWLPLTYMEPCVHAWIIKVKVNKILNVMNKGKW